MRNLQSAAHVRLYLMFFTACWPAAGAAVAQTAKPLPDAPSAVQTGQAKDPEPQAGDAIYAPLAVGRDTLRIKFEDYVVITFGPRAIVSPAISAAIKMARPPANYPREWKDGAEAFGRNYGNALGSKVTLETARFATGALLHEDIRYRPSASRNGFARFGHALGYTLVDSSDTGERRLAVANFVGAAAGGFVSNAWLPDGYNRPRDGARRTGGHLVGFAVSNVLREYSPEIYRTFHSAHLPFPRLPFPEWWTKDLSVARRQRP